MRKIQIGVMGSMADLGYAKATEKLAEQVGFWVAKNNATLVFGAEKDADSLSTAACRGAKRAGGLTIGVTYGKGLDVYEKNVDVVIASGLERGGGREFTLALSCDAIITLNGGSGTLTEIAVAYQANIPVVVLKGSGGWSAKLAGKYLDDRKRIKAEVATTPKKAVALAFRLIKEKQNKLKDILVLTATHGNEQIGVEVMKKINKELSVNRFSWVVANEQAYKKSKRFIDTDLNRSAPGKETSNSYEFTRAYRLLQMATSYPYVIDIHGTTARTGIFTIVTNPSLENLSLAAALPIQNIVIWSSNGAREAGPLTRFVPRGVEIECGPKDSPEVRGQLLEVMKAIQISDLGSQRPSFKGKNVFQVYGKLAKVEYDPTSFLIDFKRTTVRGEKFFPFLVGEYKEIACYKMRKLNFTEIFSY